jgi:hypothetical protein
VRGHVGINFCEGNLVGKFDDEHRGPACIKQNAA